MAGIRTEASRDLRGPAWLLDGTLHLAALLLVLGALDARWGVEVAVAGALLFPITYLLGPMTLGIVAGDWLAFAFQLVAIVGAVGLAGVPRMDRAQETRRGCLQVLASATLLVIVDLALHVASLALVIDRVNEAWGKDGALLAAAAFPITYLVGPLWLGVTAGDWLPFLLQAAAFGLIGLLIVVSDA